MNRSATARISIFVALLAGPAGAATFYVAPPPLGSDSAQGQEGTPFATVQRALDFARAGDTVLVRAGRYAGSVTFRFSGAPDQPITLKSYPGERAVIDQGADLTTTAQAGSRVLVQAEAGSQALIGWLVIENLEITRGYDGIKLTNAHDIVIRDNDIHDNLHHGIVGAGYKVTVERNIISSNGKAEPLGLPTSTGDLHGMSVNGSYFSITNNLIHSNLGYGIQVAGYPTTSPGALEYSGGRNFLIANNTIAFQKNRGALSLWQNQVADCSIENNIFFDNGEAQPENEVQGINFQSTGSGHSVKNNLFYSTSGKYAVGDTANGGSFTDSDNIEGDPRLVDPTANDFHLQPSSPAILAGLPLNDVPTDFDGVPRPVGGMSDIGAYQHKSVSGFDFDFQGASEAMTLVQGGSGVMSFTALGVDGFPQGITFSVKSTEPSVTTELSRTSCTPDCSLLLTVSTTAATKVGESDLLVTALGSTSHVAIVHLTVLAPSAPEQGLDMGNPVVGGDGLETAQPTPEKPSPVTRGCSTTGDGVLWILTLATIGLLFTRRKTALFSSIPARFSSRTTGQRNR